MLTEAFKLVGEFDGLPHPEQLQVLAELLRRVPDALREWRDPDLAAAADDLLRELTRDETAK
jgi:hypothetical protein